MSSQTTGPTRSDTTGRGRHGRNFRIAGVAVSLFFSVYLVSLAVNAVENNPHHVPPWLIITLYAVYAISFMAIPTLSHRASKTVLTLAFIATFALAGLLVYLGGIDTIYVFMYPINSISFAAPIRVALTIDGIFLSTMALVTLNLEGQDEALGQLLLFGSMAAVTLLMGRLVHSNRALLNAQEEIARLATEEERHRIARDLHDILGHTLTTVTVKAALARRLLESGADHATTRAGTEIADVEQLARQTLGEVRATVSGYRETNLATELVAVRTALAAADITADLPTATDDITEPQRTAFAYVLREGVTNVIRHSGANRCAVRIAPSTLEIRDNGRGGHAPPGNGLSGLRERLTAIGATLTAGPDPDGGYTLTVRLEA